MRFGTLLLIAWRLYLVSGQILKQSSKERLIRLRVCKYFIYPEIVLSCVYPGHPLQISCNPHTDIGDDWVSQGSSIHYDVYQFLGCQLVSPVLGQVTRALHREKEYGREWWMKLSRHAASKPKGRAKHLPNWRTTYSSFQEGIQEWWMEHFAIQCGKLCQVSFCDLESC